MSRMKYATRYQREKAATEIARGYAELMKGPHIRQALEAIVVLLSAPVEVRREWEPIVDSQLELLNRTLKKGQTA